MDLGPLTGNPGRGSPLGAGRAALLVAILGAAGQAAAQDLDGREAIEEAQRLASRGQDQEAIEILRRFLEAHPEDPLAPPAHLTLAIIYSKRRQFDPQLTHAEKALELAPRAPWRESAELTRATALAGVGRALEARPIVEELARTAAAAAVRDEAAKVLHRLSPIGQPAPELEIDRWIRGRVRLEDLTGKVVVLHFFEGCQGCQEAYPAIARLEADWGEAVHSIGLAVGPVGSAGPWLERQRPALDAVAVDAGGKATWDRFRGGGSPFCAVIDPEGRVVHLDYFDADVVGRVVEEARRDGSRK